MKNIIQNLLNNLFQGNWLAGLFRWVRQVIEEADRPLSLLIMVLLPFIAPVIPALVTARNLVKYMEYTPDMALLAAIAFALVGYVSMITAIGAIMNFVEQERNQRVWLPVFITIGSYLVYVLALVMINIVLELNNGVEGTKVFVTALMTLGLEIPASLLNGTRISNRDKGDREKELRRERKEERLERLRIKSGKFLESPVESSIESSEKVSSRNGNFLESSGKSPDWRKVRPQLSKSQLESLANLSPEAIRQYSAETGFTYKTISNWRANARGELGMKEN